mmetsp:Transcript_80718/g.184993  ORF Transcript_80718/g.184993 Transcript_80718/m.184993 type:complete len:284 (+) Transcript_80718:644-1495(+)
MVRMLIHEVEQICRTFVVAIRDDFGHRTSVGALRNRLGRGSGDTRLLEGLRRVRPTGPRAWGSFGCGRGLGAPGVAPLCGWITVGSGCVGGLFRRRRPRPLAALAALGADPFCSGLAALARAAWLASQVGLCSGKWVRGLPRRWARGCGLRACAPRACRGGYRVRALGLEHNGVLLHGRWDLSQLRGLARWKPVTGAGAARRWARLGGTRSGSRRLQRASRDGSSGLALLGQSCEGVLERVRRLCAGLGLGGNLLCGRPGFGLHFCGCLGLDLPLDSVVQVAL